MKYLFDIRLQPRVALDNPLVTLATIGYFHLTKDWRYGYRPVQSGNASSCIILCPVASLIRQTHVKEGVRQRLLECKPQRIKET